MRRLNTRAARGAKPARDATASHAAGRRGVLRVMTSRRWLPAVISLAAAGAVVAVPAAASASPRWSPVIGHVYLDDNTAGTNTIAAFDRHPDGTLTAEPGSPFTAGGAGTGAGLASQGAIQLAGGGRFLLSVDAGSNQIVVRGSARRVAPPQRRAFALAGCCR